ncbi:MAG: acyltransferase [Saprospiraceae bacterium]|nr:1-acyl-sn-glycerol-3-phosphate acyltransferase [Bacteroidia bacterium]NNL90939.1 acyltransferase [Saprospiraceae bacterium]
MMSKIAQFILKILGWKIVGEFPHHVKKKLLIAAPHTSNWDFPLGILVRTAIKANVKYVGKPSLFKPPLSWVMYPLGGMPVVIKEGQSFVENVVDMYKSTDEMTILIAPEGQRKKIEKFKTGFYYIANGAKVPILPVILDFAKKEFRFLDMIETHDNPKEEIPQIENLFKGVVGYRTKDSF